MFTLHVVKCLNYILDSIMGEKNNLTIFRCIVLAPMCMLTPTSESRVHVPYFHQIVSIMHFIFPFGVK